MQPVIPLVDDNELINMMTKEQLEMNGCEVDTAQNVESNQY